MTDPRLADVVAGCSELLRMAAGEQRQERAREFGAFVAGAEVDLRDIVTTFMAAGSAEWAQQEPGDDLARVRSRGAVLLVAMSELLAAVLEGFLQSARTQLALHDAQRAVFVNDLLSGRAHPGGLAERAHRYGIRLSASHAVIVARGIGFTEALAHSVDSALATRFGEGNTLTSLRGDDLVCVSGRCDRFKGMRLKSCIVEFIDSAIERLVVVLWHLRMDEGDGVVVMRRSGPIVIVSENMLEEERTRLIFVNRRSVYEVCDWD